MTTPRNTGHALPVRDEPRRSHGAVAELVYAIADVGTAVRVVIAEDDVLFRQGLAALLDRFGYTVVGQAGQADQLVELVREHLPDVVVVDVRMPPTYTAEGIEAAGLIRQEFPGTKILVLSAHVEPAQAAGLLRQGTGIGYLLKQRIADVDEFSDAMRRIVNGGSVIDPAVVRVLIEGRRPHGHPLTRLSARERDVLGLVAEGRSNAGIAHRLSISEGTVEKHLHSLYTRLDLNEHPDDHRRVLAALTFLTTA